MVYILIRKCWLFPRRCRERLPESVGSRMASSMFGVHFDVVCVCVCGIMETQSLLLLDVKPKCWCL